MTKRPEGPTLPAPRRWGRLRSIVVSWDLWAAVPAGLAVSLLPAYSKAVATPAQLVLLGAAAIGAAVAALVLTALTVLISSITPAYRRVLQKVPGGATGPLLPFTVVIVVAASAAVFGLVAALAWPLVASHRWIAFAVFAVPSVVTIWGLLGCIQVIGQLIQHMAWRDEVEDLERRREALKSSA